MTTKTKYWKAPKNRNILTGFYENPEEDKKMARELIVLPGISFVSVRNGKRVTA